MIKKIALGGMFIFASAFSLSTATAVTGQTPAMSATAKRLAPGTPAAPVPQGLCPGKC